LAGAAASLAGAASFSAYGVFGYYYGFGTGRTIAPSLFLAYPPPTPGPSTI